MKPAILNKSSGFTLIELMVVISIIGLMATTVLTSLQNARTRAQYTVVVQELKMIGNAILIAGTGSERLQAITGNNCSDCSCRSSGADLRNIDEQNTPEALACLSRLRPGFERIVAASPAVDSYETIRLDPWGAPYMLDENELEVATDINPCRRNDTIRSVGADGRFNTADDYVILLPFRTPTCRQ
jgi:prepilin-type N-terminal cleavage/methylation domain-containing protein